MDAGLDLSAVRARRHEATQSLLGDTIAITDEQWRQPTALPGWTRAHIAAHLARQADGLRHIMDQLRDNRPTSLYRDATAYRDDIERGSEQTALGLQTDLDTSAGRLHARFAELLELPCDRPVQLSPRLTVRLDHLPITRLNEVVLHHIDLDVGFTFAGIEPDVAAWLLEFNAALIGRDSAYPAIRLVPDSGATALIGGPGRPHVVQGPDNRLLGWLTGRLGPEGIADHLPALPLR